MAIGSLSRFTVPLASDQSATTQGILMPKLKYRFRLSFENFGYSVNTTELTKQVAKAARPKFTSESQDIWVYNSRVNYVGRPKWDPIGVSIRDDVLGNVAKLVGEQLQKQFDFYEQSSAATGSDYKFTMRIEMLDGGNGIITTADPANPSSPFTTSGVNVLETWECYGCFIVSPNWGDLAYAEQTPMTIDFQVQPDNCLQITGGIDSNNPPPRGVGGTMITASGSRIGI